MSKEQAGERLIHVTFWNRNKRALVRKTRQYKTLDTAARKAVQLMILEGKVGEIAELFHALTGLQFGTVHLSAKGNIVVNYNEPRLA
jgi:hypothetical protein